jgi:hypothetical protein
MTVHRREVAVQSRVRCLQTLDGGCRNVHARGMGWKGGAHQNPRSDPIAMRQRTAEGQRDGVEVIDGDFVPLALKDVDDAQLLGLAHTRVVKADEGRLVRTSDAQHTAIDSNECGHGPWSARVDAAAS